MSDNTIPSARARLTWQDDNGAQEYLIRNAQTIVIGRSRDNTIMIAHPKISRQHASLEWQGETCYLRDLGSSNGTFLNGNRLQPQQPHPLKPGDRIELHQVLVLFDAPYKRQELDPVEMTLSGEATAFGFVTEGKSAFPQLIIHAGPNTGETYTLRESQTTIGRASSNAEWQIRLADRAVSRPHARIEISPEMCLLHDLNSANGTLLNNKPVTEPMPLNDGDIITIGETRLTFRAAQQ
ncbi:MAG: hypothetical protein OHK0052_15170 [Anaerolineales bacterium]